MTHKITENIYRIELPVSVGLLDSVNVYLILGEPSLLIDTGYDREELRSLLDKSLSELGVSIERSDIFLTHMHPDHAELALRLASEGRTVRIGEAEAEILSGLRKGPEAGADRLRSLGFGDEFINEFSKITSKRRLPVDKSRLLGVNEGDRLNYGGYELLCIDISGHSPGQTGLYIADKGMLICGDHILYGVTPSVNAWDGEPNPLSHYIKNLLKLRDLEIETLLPGHRTMTCPVSQRIEQLISRRNKKLEETLMSLRRGGCLSPFELSSLITWSTRWDRLSTFQKFSAVGEVAVNLEYLVSLGEAEKQPEGCVLRYAAL